MSLGGPELLILGGLGCLVFTAIVVVLVVVLAKKKNGPPPQQ
jgi:hypothetical protein